MSVSVEEALEVIYKTIKVKSKKLINIENALGYILAEDIQATHSLPPFNNSAMDGFAIQCESKDNSLKVTGAIFAGDDFSGKVEAGCAVKIMTGAKVPNGAEAVVPIEDVSVDGEQIILNRDIKQNQHIRFLGEDIKKGDNLLKDGEKVTAYTITLLASQGISHITVYKKPLVTVFSSGNELKMHYENVESYQIYNTNTPMLASRARELGCEVNVIHTVEDNLESMSETIKELLDSDLIITSGGVSVGEADFTKDAFRSVGCEILFDKIDIKPGKPTTFGFIDSTYVLNLPGNPLAAAYNFELFATSMISAISGANEKYLSSITTTLKEAIKIKQGRRTLVPGFFNGDSFQACDKYAPGMVSPLNKTNSFIMISEEVAELKKGSTIKVMSTHFELRSSEQNSLVTL
ncbi:MAG: molybdopterin molybdenumtransferase MoeA [Helicobacteraceae bacterium]|nr:molybdopterin molybdenumtransferase MoeA [Helicobacteraceae bacterium]